MEDEELARAIALSLQSNAHASKPGSSSKSSASEFLAQRARDEKARLERLGQVSASGDNSRVGTRRSRGEDGEDDLPAAKRQVLESRTVRGSSSDGLFWDGEVRQTFNQYSQPRADGKPTFKMSEVIGNKKDVAFAIISSFVVDIGWISRSFDSDTPVILVTQPGADGKESVSKVFPNWIQTTPFLAGGYGCYHMKFMLLFYKTGRLRVVVSSANLVDYDWCEIENTVWLQDIPLLETPDLGEKAETTFAGSLQYILNNVHVKPALERLGQTHPNLPLKSIKDLGQKWDFSRVKAHLVASISGKHEGWEGVVRTGHPRLMAIAREIGFKVTKNDKKQVFALECQGSSIGSYTTQWLNEFYWSACGGSAEEWLGIKKKDRGTEEFSPIKIVYPTNGTVVKSVMGPGGGGTLFCRERQWNGPVFPKHLFHDSKSKGGNVTMHSKMIIALPVDKNKEADGAGRSKQNGARAIGWAYIGSHNFTASAWGEMTGKPLFPKLKIVNYEVGVVLPLSSEPDANRIACYKRPAPRYKSGELPWMQG